MSSVAATVAEEALAFWDAATAREQLAKHWMPALFDRFAGAVRSAHDTAPLAVKRAGLLAIAKQVLRSAPQTREALARDPALARWVAGVEDAVAAADHDAKLQAVLALLPRFAVAVAMREGGDLDVPLALGATGLARIPADGRMLQGPPARALRAQVRKGGLITHARPRLQVGPFELADGAAEGGRTPAVRPLTGADSLATVKPLAAGLKLLTDTAPRALAEAAALCPVLVAIAPVPAGGRPGSRPELRGCIWMPAPDDPWQVAENLLWEASHAKLRLVHDADPLVGAPDPPRFTVPWRPDPRPALALLLRLHAQVRALCWLRLRADSADAAQAAMRRPALSDGARQTAEILTRADGLTANGRALVERLSAEL